MLLVANSTSDPSYMRVMLVLDHNGSYGLLQEAQGTKLQMQCMLLLML